MKTNITETHKKMVLRLKKPGEAILKSLTPEKCDFVHMGACLAGEAAEVYDALKSGAKADVIEECGDWEFYWTAEMERMQISRTGLCTKTLRTPLDHSIELMRLGGHYWDVIKRIVVYQKDMGVPDKKFDGKTLMEAAKELLCEMEENMNSIYFLTMLNLDGILEANYYKLVDADKGRYGAEGYTDAAAQERRDKLTNESN